MSDRFYDRFQTACPILVETLRDAIKKDVDHTSDATLHLRSYNKYQVALPAPERVSAEFNRAFQDAVVDRDIEEDLLRSHVINWCRTTKRLLPLKTTADGNCLLHAISQGMWGIEDSDNFLRRLVYMNIVLDKGGQYKKRWLLHQQAFLQSAHMERLNTETYNVEWENVIKATDDVSSPDSHGLPYQTLEAIHLYVAANSLRRPIIVLSDTVARSVFGQSIQQNHIGGVYLPLDTPAERCYKSPLVIGYSMNHFAPLVFEQDRSVDTVEMQAVPLVTQAVNMLECKFLLPNEEADGVKCLQAYLNLKEVVFDGTTIPAAVMNHCPVPDCVNIVSAFTKNCERKFAEITGQTIRLPGTSEQRSPALGANGEHFILPPGGLTLPQDFKTTGHYGPFHQTGQLKCLTVSCKNPGDLGLRGLCLHCFNDFTVQYAKQEEARRRIMQNSPPVQPGFQRVDLTQEKTASPLRQQQPSGTLRPLQTAVPVRLHPTQARSEEYFDLSMLADDCKAKCGFKCATGTYPYCHECYPKYVTCQAQPFPAAAGGTNEAADLSLTPDKCLTPSCTFKCSKATVPYCHECFQTHQTSGTTQPTAPPNSVEIQPGSPNVVSLENPQPCQQLPNSDETAVVSLRDRSFIRQQQPSRAAQPLPLSGHNCKTLECRSPAVKGNDGYCEHCYQLTLFEPNVPQLEMREICAKPFCNKPAVPPLRLCSICFVSDKTGQGNQNLSGPYTSATQMNIYHMPETKILNHTQTGHEASGTCGSIPTEHDETALERLSPIALKLQRQKLENLLPENDKYICSTPGCQGLRILNKEFCADCTKQMFPIKSEETVPDPEQNSANLALQEDPLVSESPVPLTRQQIQELNPVVLSSKDKKKCSYTGCENMIYPPKKLCDDCTADLDRAKSEKSRQKSKDDARKEEGGSTKCKTEGCQFYGAKEFGGYCSSCHKGKVKIPKAVSAPLAKRTLPVENNLRRNITEPIAQVPQQKHTISQPGSPVKGRPCLEKGCTRYGDPVQGYRCSQHYTEAHRNYPPTSEESIKRLQPLVFQTNHMATAAGVNAGIFAHGNQQPTENNDQFHDAYQKLLTSRKSKNLCKNSAAIGCQNYGNVANNGYCNTCFENMKVTEHIRRR